MRRVRPVRKRARQIWPLAGVIWPTTLDRAPMPYGVMALLLGAVVLAEQIMEQALLGPIEKFFTPNNLRFGLALPALTIYMLLAPAAAGCLDRRWRIRCGSAAHRADQPAS